MTKLEHIEEAERLLSAAKDVARASAADDRASQATMLNLLDFARLHAMIAAAL